MQKFSARFAECHYRQKEAGAKEAGAIQLELWVESVFYLRKMFGSAIIVAGTSPRRNDCRVQRELGQTINALRRDDAPSSGTSELGESRRIYLSVKRATRKLRSVFGEHTMYVFVYHASDDPNSPIVGRPVDERLGISPDRYSPLLQEYSLLFCCEQAFHGAAEAFETVFRRRLSADTLEK